MSTDEWKRRCESEMGLQQGVPLPDTVDWKSVHDKKPLGRNLLRNPAPHGLSKDSPPPEPELTGMPPCGPPRFEPEAEGLREKEVPIDLFLPDDYKARLQHDVAISSTPGDFTGWSTSREVLPYDSSGIPPGAVVCHLPQYSWFSMEQVVDLKAEGLWDELLDDFQPDIVIEDCYEESQVHESIYQLHVKLLGADKQTVISEHTANPTEDLSNYSHTWKEVSHVFSGYGPGVRYVHFVHRLKNSFMVELFPTLVTGSAVLVRPTRSNC